MIDSFSADANPEKRLFISLLTRDISTIAAILDLIDNSINSVLERFSARLASADGYVAVLEDTDVTPTTDIRINISRDRISIADDAEGISASTAELHVFKFGRGEDEENESDRLSVYGLGLKRAFFKLGRHVRITSDHRDGGFSMDLDVVQWAKESHLPWRFQLRRREAVGPAGRSGTTIEISEPYHTTVRRLEDGVFFGQLEDAIGRTYAFFLTKFVRIVVNGVPMSPMDLRVGENNTTDRFELDSVTCTITAGLGTPEDGRYRDRGSGWFVFCNGRAIISADKTPLTGWNSDGLPIFQPKHRPFLGTVFFVSRYPDRLPWDTTKSGINEDSVAWQLAKRRMASVAKSVVAYLDRRYSGAGSDKSERDLTSVAQTRLDAMKASAGATRRFAPPRRKRRDTIRVQYDAKRDHVESIAQYLDRPGMSASEVGRHTFDYFFDNEVSDEI